MGVGKEILSRKGHKMKARSGFTLVEILIVVIILGILAAIVIPQFTDASTQARVSSLKSNLQTVRSQIELYKVQHNDALPGAGTADFEAAMTGQTGIAGAAGTDYGPYLQQLPANPFNNKSSVRPGGAAAGANTDGWRFDTTTGAFQADDGGTTDTVAHADM
jgi:type II secretion system protein G